MRNRKVSSRAQIQIKEVRDNILVLPKQYCGILECSSINFELKSEAEQDVIIDSFQNFLNALPCRLQILIRTREIDIDKYIEDMEKNLESEEEEIYREQIKNYCLFIKKLVSGNKILSRYFYIIISHRPDKRSDFKLIREHLDLEKDIIIKGMEKIQMKARMLTDLEIINLFYGFYNPENLKTQEITQKTLESLAKNYV